MLAFKFSFVDSCSLPVGSVQVFVEVTWQFLFWPLEAPQVNVSDWFVTLRLRGGALTNGLLLESDEALWLVHWAEGEGLQGLRFLGDGGELVAAAAASNPGDGEENERAEHQGGAAEEESGRVTSCDVNEPTCSQRRRRRRWIFKK